MGIYRDRVLPVLVDRACGGEAMARWRARAAEGLAGTVVEIGFSSGHNVPIYPDEVTEVLAVEPSEQARELAAARIDERGLPVTHVGLDGQRLPLDDVNTAFEDLHHGELARSVIVF